MKREYLAAWSLACLLLSALPAQSCEFRIGWMGWTQPDGTTFVAHAHGDEFGVVWETADGYRFKPDFRTGWYYYAERDSRGELVRGPLRVGVDDPAAHGIPKGLERSAARKAEVEDEMRRRGFLSREEGPVAKIARGSTQTWTSPCSLHVVLVTFEDDPGDSYDQPYGYSKDDFLWMLFGGYNQGVPSFEGDVTLSNGEEPPTQYGSLAHYYNEMSGGDFELRGNILNDEDQNGDPIWIRLDNTKTWWKNSSFGAFTVAARDSAVSAGLSVPTPSLSHKIAYMYSGA